MIVAIDIYYAQPWEGKHALLFLVDNLADGGSNPGTILVILDLCVASPSHPTSCCVSHWIWLFPVTLTVLGNFPFLTVRSSSSWQTHEEFAKVLESGFVSTLAVCPMAHCLPQPSPFYDADAKVKYRALTTRIPLQALTPLSFLAWHQITFDTSFQGIRCFRPQRMANEQTGERHIPSLV